LLEAIPGYSEVVAWFGLWPSFHDAEIVDIHLKRAAASYVRILAWITSTETDSEGYFLREKFATIVIAFDGLRDIHLGGFSSQNVIAGLDLEVTETGAKLTLHPCFGVSGTIEAETVRLEVHPPQTVA